MGRWFEPSRRSQTKQRVAEMQPFFVFRITESATVSLGIEKGEQKRSLSHHCAHRIRLVAFAL
jgi:hypothetical protein